MWSNAITTGLLQLEGYKAQFRIWEQTVIVRMRSIHHTCDGKSSDDLGETISSADQPHLRFSEYIQTLWQFVQDNSATLQGIESMHSNCVQCPHLGGTGLIDWSSALRSKFGVELVVRH